MLNVVFVSPVWDRTTTHGSRVGISESIRSDRVVPFYSCCAFHSRDDDKPANGIPGGVNLWEDLFAYASQGVFGHARAQITTTDWISESGRRCVKLGENRPTETDLGPRYVGDRLFLKQRSKNITLGKRATKIRVFHWSHALARLWRINKIRFQQIVRVRTRWNRRNVRNNSYMWAYKQYKYTP